MPHIRQRIACKALIRHNEKILILREAATYKEGTNVGKYHLPGGRIEPGERYMDGLLREVIEETGLQVTVGKPLFVGEWHPVIKGEQNQIIAIFFLCTAATPEVTLSEEHDDYRWIEPEDYRTFALMPPEHEVIEAYLADKK